MLIIGNCMVLIFSERVPGVGWDGFYISYFEMARDFKSCLFEKGISDYAFHRILPSGLIHCFLLICHIPRDAHHVLLGFQIFNSLMILLGFLGWERIARLLNFSETGKWMGFFGLFLNFAILKFNFYIPLLTDITAFTLGIWMCYFYFSNQRTGMLMMLLLGFFTWPTFSVCYLPLLFWPRRHSEIQSAPRFSQWISVIMAILFMAGSFYVCYRVRWFWTGAKIIGCVPVSIVLMGVYLYLIFRVILQSNDLFSSMLYKTINPLNFILGVALLSALYLLRYIYSTHYVIAEMYTFNQVLVQWLKNYFFLGIRQPLVFIVAHIIYFGPFLFLTIFYFKKFVHVIHHFGIGLTVTILITLMRSINPESRQLISLFPLFVILTVMVLNSYHWKTSHVIGLGVLSLIYTKMWLLINHPAVPTGTDYTKFPWQKLFMSVGWYMSSFSYFVQTGAVILTGLGMYWFYFYRQRNTFSIKLSQE